MHLKVHICHALQKLGFKKNLFKNANALFLKTVPSTENTDTETSEPPTTPNIATTDSDSFLKISNIMSLAAPNENETPAVSNPTIFPQKNHWVPYNVHVSTNLIFQNELLIQVKWF